MAEQKVSELRTSRIHCPIKPKPNYKRPLYILACMMHLVVLAYHVIWTLVILTARVSDLKPTNMYEPNLTVAMHVGVALLYVCSIVFLHKRQSRVGPSNQLVVHPSSVRFIDAWSDTLIATVNVVEIGCQSFQTYKMFNMMVDHGKAVAYASIVVLYTFVSPWILFVRKARTKRLLANVADAVFCFTLSCGFPLAAILWTLLVYVFSDFSVSDDNVWFVTTISLARLLVPSSSFDLTSKCGIHLGTLIALYRMLQNSMEPTKLLATVPVTRSNGFRRMVHLNLLINFSWGSLLATAVIVSSLNRTFCPTYCLADTRPLLDLTCACLYASVNCHTLNISDPEPLLRPHLIGTAAIILQISRCELHNGPSASVLAPFQQLAKIAILFTNMTAWEGPIPAATYYIQIRFSQLRHLPRVLTSGTQHELVVLTIESLYPLEIPPDVYNEWPKVNALALINVGMETLSPALMAMPALENLNLRYNNLSRVSSTTLESPDVLKKILWFRLAWTDLPYIPWNLIERGARVDISGNPVSAPLPLTQKHRELIHEKKLVVDDTSFCNESGVCDEMCADKCATIWIGDHYCDWACFVSSCEYDGGDCDEFGFDKV